jgi:hypothetical protein
MPYCTSKTDLHRDNVEDILRTVTNRNQRVPTRLKHVVIETVIESIRPELCGKVKVVKIAMLYSHGNHHLAPVVYLGNSP